MRSIWPEVMDALQKRSRVKWAMMNEVAIAQVDGEDVRLVAPPGLVRRISDESTLSMLREVLASVVSGNWKLTVTAANSGQNAPSHNPGPHSQSAPDGPPEPAVDPRERLNRMREEAKAAEPSSVGGQAKDDDGVDEESDAISESRSSGIDPETAAIELLKSGLGARPMDG